MRRIKISLKVTSIVIMAMAAAIWFGCSETPTAPDMSGNLYASALTEYFPLNSGAEWDFQVINHSTGDTSYHTYVLGGRINVDGNEVVYSWLAYNPQYPHFVDTGYICLDGNLLSYYDNLYSGPEVILQTPFAVGKTWKRYTTSKGLLDSTSLNLSWDYDGLKDNDNTDPPGGDNPFDYYDKGGAGKTYPTLGANKFNISAVEDIMLNNKSSYKNCLKVENSTSISTNCYWYAPKIGLVKYAIAIDTVSYPKGVVVGERISSSQISIPQ